MKSKPIVIKKKQIEKLKPGECPVVRLTPEAYNILVEISNAANMSMKEAASEVIEQALQLIDLQEDAE